MADGMESSSQRRTVADRALRREAAAEGALSLPAVTAAAHRVPMASRTALTRCTRCLCFMRTTSREIVCESAENYA